MLEKLEQYLDESLVNQQKIIRLLDDVSHYLAALSEDSAIAAADAAGDNEKDDTTEAPAKPKAKAKAKATPAPTYSQSDVIDALKGVVNALGKEAALGLLSTFDVERVSELDAKQYGEFIDAASAKAAA